MTDLDTSNHSLNNSSSKQKFSFPKTDRFRMQGKILYILSHSDAIVSMRYQVPAQAGLRRSATGTKLWGWGTNVISLPLAHTSWVLSSKKMNTKDLV